MGNKNGQHQLGTQRRGEGRGKRLSKGNLIFISKISHQKILVAPTWHTEERKLPGKKTGKKKGEKIPILNDQLT